MMLEVRHERARVIDGNHVLAAGAVTISAIALADMRVAALAVVVLTPLLLLARRPGATFHTSSISVAASHELSNPLERAGSIALIEADGPLLFLSVPQIDRLLPERPPWPDYVILDLRAATMIDASALAALRDLLHALLREQGEFALVCTPGSSTCRTLQRSGLVAQALGGTTCFRLEHALTRIAARHADTDEEPEQTQPVQNRPRLYLVHSATHRGE